MYLIFHAFSRRNEGDGLLVDLTLEALAAAGIDADSCILLALDPESFADLKQVERAPGEPRSVPSTRLIGAVGALSASLIGRGRLTELARDAQGIVAVGGGYLVADSPVRQAGVLLNHLAQLRTAASSAAPSIYLPQSIGPLRSPAGPPVRRQLRRLDRLYVRDDQTFRELDWPNVRRCADLAVMKLARSLSQPNARAATGPGVIVARDLPRAPGYHDRLRRLRAALPDAVWAVQADVQGPRSDRAFYQRLEMGDAGSLTSVLSDRRPPAVVSVRLHGAIAALLAGVPAVHLAYERKGWGAYQDLGLERWVHDARSFDPALVARQVTELGTDPSEMWAAVNGAREKLNAQYGALIADLRALLGPEPDRG